MEAVAVLQMDAGATLVVARPAPACGAACFTRRGVSMLQVKERRRPRRRLTTSHSRKTERPHRLSPPAFVLPPSAKTSERTDLPSKKRTRTSSRRASISPNARKRAPRMTPLQPSGGAASSGGVLDAEWDGRLEAASSAPTGTGVFPGAGLQCDNKAKEYGAPGRTPLPWATGKSPLRSPLRVVWTEEGTHKGCPYGFEIEARPVTWKQGETIGDNRSSQPEIRRIH